MPHAIEDEIVRELEVSGYHPRSSKQSDFQSLLIINDLVAQCPLLGERAKSGEVVAKLRHHQQVGHADWVIDIAIGTCAGAPLPPKAPETIRIGPPVIIQIAIELKSIWTEHGKARLNRLRDFQSFHGYAHQYNERAVAAAFLLVNSAERFWSPLRASDDITAHGKTARAARVVAEKTVDRFRSIHLRNSEHDQAGLEALGVIVIEHDNLKINPNAPKYADLHRASAKAPQPPSLPIGDPLHYQSMIQRICGAYSMRFPA